MSRIHFLFGHRLIVSTYREAGYFAITFWAFGTSIGLNWTRCDGEY